MSDPITAALAPIRQRCRQPGTPDSALLQAAYAQACDDRERLLRALEYAVRCLHYRDDHDVLAAILRGEEP